MMIVDSRLTSHEVGADSEVRVRVTVGATQRGVWTVALGVDPVDKGTDSRWVALGSGKSLRGNHLQVSALVMDIGDATDDLQCAVEVAGTVTTVVELRRPAGHGDGAAYSLSVLFR
jgi:hypothetical protein